MPNHDSFDEDDLSVDQLEDYKTLSQIKRSRVDLQRRYVFLCPTLLAKNFEALPTHAKESALLVFRCSHNWFFQDSIGKLPKIVSKTDCGLPKGARSSTTGKSPSRGGLRKSVFRLDFSDGFLKWVAAREQQGCVFWLKPEKDLSNLSAFFECKLDPTSGQAYRPLLLDAQWWRIRFNRHSSRYVGSLALIVATVSERSKEGVDLRDQDIDLRVLQEIIFQSNPSLEPLAKWPYAPSMRFVPRECYLPAYDGKVRHKGYIDPQYGRGISQQRAISKHEQARVSEWPPPFHARLDNLHHSWQVEDAAANSRQLLTLNGCSSLDSTGLRPLTVR